MSKDTKATTPAAAPELPCGSQPLAKSYTLGKATVCYHDAQGNAYNAQQRYVGKADEAKAKAAAEAKPAAPAKPEAAKTDAK